MINPLSLSPKPANPGQSAAEPAEMAGSGAVPATFAAALSALEQAMTGAAGDADPKGEAAGGNPPPAAGKILPVAAKVGGKSVGKAAKHQAGAQLMESGGRAEDNASANNAISAELADEGVAAAPQPPVAAVLAAAVVPAQPQPAQASDKADPAVPARGAAPSPVSARNGAVSALAPAMAEQPKPASDPAARMSPPAEGATPAALAAAKVKANGTAAQPFAVTITTDDKPQAQAARTLPMGGQIPRELRVELVETPVATVTAPSAMPSAAHAAAPLPTAPQAVQSGAQDFSTLVDRLVAARDAAQGDVVRVALPHAEFGRVALHFRNDDSGLSVTMTSADPGFARAVNAALPAQNAGGADSSATGSGQHQQRGDAGQAGASGDRGGAGAGQGQAQTRGQHVRAERFDHSAARPRSQGQTDHHGEIFA